jgi:hypothetical protein
MRNQDIAAFRACAKHYKLWILVRGTIADILERRVGAPDCTPKPLTCKAKTADNPGHSLAGLVVNPHLHEGAFSSEKKLSTAVDCWAKMASAWLRRPDGAMASTGLPYEVVENRGSPDYGALLLHTAPCRGRCKTAGCAKKIHGDYDLYDIVDPRKYAQNAANVVHVTRQFADARSEHVEKVRAYVNNAIGIPMIQHGAQMQYSGHSDEPLEVFSPSGKHRRTRNGYDNEWLYLQTFRDRQALEL